MADTFVDRLVPVLSRGDLVAAYELLHDLDGDELREAQTWFAGSRRWFRELGAHVTYAGEDHDARFATRHEAEWIVGMCAVLLCGPRTAAERVPWQSLRDWTEHNGEAAFVQLLWDRPREWVAEFVDAASQVRLGAQGQGLQRPASPERCAQRLSTTACPAPPGTPS